MSTNEKTANEIIEELEAEKTELLKTLDAANNLIEADSKMHAKYMEKSIELIKLAKENQRLRKLNAEMLDALETLLSECERVDYKPTQPLRFLSYNPDIIAKAFKAVKKAMAEGLIPK